MTKSIDKPAKEKRLGFALTAAEFDDFAQLAKIEGVQPAVLVRRIVFDYLDARADLIAEARRAEAAYQESLKRIRGSYAAN